MRINKAFLTLAAAVMALAATIPATQAQNTMVTSPYSRYGYGLLNDHATSMQRAMGGVGYAMNSGRQINVMNPASYAAIDSLTFLFDIGMDMSLQWNREGSKYGRDFGGGLDYITMQVPITKYLGASAGLLPYSSVGYAFGGETDNGNETREGSGGLNQLYLGLSGKIVKGLTVGANISYLWGEMTNTAFGITDPGVTGGTTAPVGRYQHVIDVKDWHVNFGVQYTINISRLNSLTFGATLSPGKDLHGHTFGTVTHGTSSSSGIQFSTPDTIGYSRLDGNFTLPDTWGAGIAYKWNQRLLAEVDFTYQNWKDAKFKAIEGWESTTFDNRWKVAAGIQYQPNPRGSYLSRINYRIGGFYNHDYITIRGNNVRDYGVSAGFGFPVPSFKTLVNLTFEYRHRQAHPDPLVKEQYFNIAIGVNFNEMWFWRNKLR